MKRTNSLKFGGITLKAHKTSGFTLAEVLITLGIIGVVAAMTIPNLIANTNGAKYRSQFKKTISTLNQVGRMSKAQYGFSFGDHEGYGMPFEDCAAAHPDNHMNLCAIFNGTLSGHTFLGDVYEVGETEWGNKVSTEVRKLHNNFYQSSSVFYQLADGSIIYMHDSSKCQLEPGQSKSVLIENACTGFIDVNGKTLPNKMVTCSIGTTKYVGESGYSDCIVKNNATNMTDIFPIIYYNDTVEPASNAAIYVLNTAK